MYTPLAWFTDPLNGRYVAGATFQYVGSPSKRRVIHFCVTCLITQKCIIRLLDVQPMFSKVVPAMHLATIH